MYRLRKPYLKRSISVFLLLLFIYSVFFPTVSLALTNGDTQPEYTTFSEGSGTDMVNMMTGDFSFELPIVEVPGPEGGFSIPLAYHAGIGLEEEASWVGLGFSLNAGAITRDIIQYPDDANGEITHMEAKDPGVRGWTATLGKYGKIGWNNEIGHYGAGDILQIITYSYVSGDADIGIVGIHVSGYGVGFNGAEFQRGMISIASIIGGVGSIYSAAASAAAAASTAASTAATVAGSTAGEAAKIGATAAAAAVSKEVTMGVTSNVLGRVAGYAMTEIAYNKVSPLSSIAVDWRYNKKDDKHFGSKDFWVWLDQTRQEEMYGALYLGKMPTVDMPILPTISTKHGELPGAVIRIKNDQEQDIIPKGYLSPEQSNVKGPASDMLTHDYLSYHNSFTSASLAKDNFNVMGNGISGRIEPYRLEVGSLAVPKDMSQQHTRLALFPYLDYKVQFKYSGTSTNSYAHHAGSASASPDINNPIYGLTTSVENENPKSNNYLGFTINDMTLKTIRREEGRMDRLKGYSNNRLAFGRNVEWYTNREIHDGVTPGFIDFQSPTERINFRGAKKRSLNFFDNNFSDGINLPGAINYYSAGEGITIFIGCKSPVDGTATPVTFKTTITSVESNKIYIKDAEFACSSSFPIGEGTIINDDLKAPADGIGGFSITRDDGITHHYALPVYSYNERTAVYNVVDRSKYSVMSREAPFATTWLLTAITGPDYIDRGNEGLDSADWGYWVKLDYGKSTDNYAWRIPYDGEKLSADGKVNSYSTGNKQLYYLNKISTRTHTALFIKEQRLDGKGYLPQASHVMYRLNEVVLLKNEAYQDLVNPSKGNLSFGVNNLLEREDFSEEATFLLNQNTLKRTLFNYSYNLCKGVPNSAQGKLTLESISSFGRNNVKVLPDYKFEYAYNPDYNEDYWDGWGYYSRSPYTKNNHTPGDKIEEGAAWSLTKLHNPLGSSISVTYERDSYGSVGGATVAKSYGFSDVANVVNDQMGWWDCGKYQIGADMDEVKIGDKVRVEGVLTYKCQDNSTGSYCFNLNGTISNVDKSNKFVWLSLNDSPCRPIPSGASSYCNTTPPASICSGARTVAVQGVIHQTISDRKGGDLRVAAFVVNDGNGNNYETRYLYTSDGRTSSGVVAMQTNYDYENTNSGATSLDPLPDWSFTPVMYAKTTVLSGYKGGTYTSKQVFEFETPNRNLITVNKMSLNSNPSGPYGHEIFADHDHFNEFLDKYLIVVDNYTSKIGAVKSVKTYDGNDKLKGSTIFTYTSALPNSQGVFTEGNIINERVNVERDKHEIYHRAIRTVKRFHPYVLQKIESTKDDFLNPADNLVSTTENKSWDFITGVVLETETSDPMGYQFIAKEIPAYHVYPEMGSKAINVDNFNMMSQVAANYSFKKSGETLGLIGASVTTWANDFAEYRELNSEGYSDSDVENHKVWRARENYVWKGSSEDSNSDGKIDSRRDDGTYIFDTNQEFNFGQNASNLGWQKIGWFSRYDHYSMPLEIKDINGKSSSSKMDLSSKRKILTASNADYTEVAFASFESDIISVDNKTYLDGEVEVSHPSQINSTVAHTGSKSYQMINPSEKGIMYKLHNNSTTEKEFYKNKHYKLSVWVNDLNGGEDQVELYYTVNNGTSLTTYTGGKTSLKAGNWHQFNLTVDKSHLANALSLEVGVRKKTTSSTTTVYVDDFRFQPINSSTAAYVYNSHDELIYTLDNQNLYSRFEYDNAGRITATYIEVLSADSSKRERKVSSRTYNVAGVQ